MFGAFNNGREKMKSGASLITAVIGAALLVAYPIPLFVALFGGFGIFSLMEHYILKKGEKK